LFGPGARRKQTPPVTPFLEKYVLGWTIFSWIAVCIIVGDRKRLTAELPAYLRFLFIPWKLSLFVPALLFVTFAGRYTDDETWDVISGGGMSFLTFLTAPGAAGLVWQVLNGRRAWRYLWVASALCLFSSSWFYDGYLLFRDGTYTHRWLGNLMLSPIIYWAAGLLWNLEAKPGGWWRLGFVREDWPEPPDDRRIGPLLIPAIPLILIAAFVLVAFVRWRLP
jgi:hypothetical protein